MNDIDNYCSVVDILKIRAKTTPLKVAYRTIDEFLEEKEKLTYEDLLLEATLCADLMIKNKINKNENVIILIDSELDFLKAFYGCMLYGIRPIPVKTDNINLFFFDNIRRIILDSNSKAIITTRNIFSKIKDYVSNIKLIVVDESLSEINHEEVIHETAPDEIAYIAYTSGSTGAPKGIMLSHLNLYCHAKFIKKTINVSEDSIFVSWLPLQHTAGLNVIALQSMFHGATCILISPKEFLKSPLIWLKAIDKYKGTITGAPNFAYDLCVESADENDVKQIDLSSLDIAFNTSQVIKASTIENFIEKFLKSGFKPSAFLNAYGMTECVAFVTGGRINCLSKAKSKNDIPDIWQSGFPNYKVVSCGFPLQESIVKVMNKETKAECLPFEIGEVVVASPAVALGYLNQEHDSSFSKYNISDKYRSYASGDLGFFDHDHNLFICGRLKEFMISNGKNIYFNDIERSLDRLSYNELSDNLTTFSVVNKNGDEQLIVIIESKINNINQDVFIEIVKNINKLVLNNTGVLPSQIVLSEINTLPRSSVGKILRYKCKELYENKKFPYLYKHDMSNSSDMLDIDNNDVEKSLISIVSHVTGWNDITLQSRLNLIGTDSLAATRIASLCKSLLKVNISISDVLMMDTIDDLLKKIKEKVDVPVCDLASYVDSQIHCQPNDFTGISCLQKEILLSENENRNNCPNENVYFEADVSGNFDLTIFKAAFSKLVQIQKQLRCVFVRNDDNFRQEYVNYPDSYFKFFDSMNSSEEKISKIISDEISKFFGLYDHVMRVIVIKREEKFYRLIFVIHHSNFDHWSVGIFMNTLFNYYERMNNKNTEINVENLIFEYSDFVAAEEKWMQSEDRKSQIDYWLKELRGIKPLELSYDFDRTKIQSHSGSLAHFNIDAETYKKIKQISSNCSATVFNFMLSVFYIILNKYSEQTDIVVGIAISNRNSKKLENVIGYFSNMLAIRVGLNLDENFVELLKKVKSKSLVAYKNSHIPPEEIVRSIKNYDETLPYRVAFLMQNTPQTTVSYKNFDLQFAELHNKSCNFDIELNITEVAENLDVTIEYCNEVFLEKTIFKIWSDYKKMIEFIIEKRADCKISNILSAILTED